jgi:hypothetical protein
MDIADQASGYSSSTKNVLGSLSDSSRPRNKTTCETQPAREENPTQSLTKLHKTYQEQQHLSPTTQEPGSSPETKPTRALHRSDQSRAPVRLVTLGQLRMNNNPRVNSPKSNS